MQICRVYRSTRTSVQPSRLNWVTPLFPASYSSVAPSTWVLRGCHTLLLGRWWGPNSDDWTDTLVFYIVTHLRHHQTMLTCRVYPQPVKKCWVVSFSTFVQVIRMSKCLTIRHFASWTTGITPFYPTLVNCIYQIPWIKAWEQMVDIYILLLMQTEYWKHIKINKVEKKQSFRHRNFILTNIVVICFLKFLNCFLSILLVFHSTFTSPSFGMKDNCRADETFFFRFKGTVQRDGSGRN